MQQFTQRFSKIKAYIKSFSGAKKEKETRKKKRNKEKEEKRKTN